MHLSIQILMLDRQRWDYDGFGVSHQFCLVGQTTDIVIRFVGQVPLSTDFATNDLFDWACHSGSYWS